MSTFFNDKLIAHFGAHGNNISTVDDLCESVGKFHLLDSFVGDYTAQILDIVTSGLQRLIHLNPKTLDQPESGLHDQTEGDLLN